ARAMASALRRCISPFMMPPREPREYAFSSGKSTQVEQWRQDGEKWLDRIFARFYRIVLPQAFRMSTVDCMEIGSARDSRAPCLPTCPCSPPLPPGFPTMTVSRPDKLLNCDHGLRRQTIVQSLLTDVFQGKLRPGQRLITQDLAERFGVSHTPIREALICLAGIGILDLVPNRGAIVRQVTTRDVHEVCQVRRVLECEATRRACGPIHLAQLHALADGIKRLMAVPAPDAADFITQARTLDSTLHDLIADCCGNAFLAKELNRLKILFRAFRDV